jgi:hypothetical protein
MPPGRRVPLQQATLKRLNFFLQSDCDHATLVHLHAALCPDDTSTHSNAFTPSAASSQAFGSFHELRPGA